MEEFDIDHALVGTGRVFPDHIEQADWIGYHGTSSFYSAQIESGGFSLVKPLPSTGVDLVVEIAKRLGLDWERVDGFNQLKSISFSPISEVALDYLRPASLGGQGVGYVKDAIEEILSGHATNIVEAESERLLAMREMIETIRSSPPVIYAVDLQGLASVQYQRLTTGIYAYEPIPASRIKAKLKISSPVNYEKVDARKLREGLRALAASPKPHFTKLLLQG